MQNPLPGFTTVEKTNTFANVQSNTNYFDSAANGTLPSVSWVMPTEGVGEHPPDNIADGEAWVTKVVNAAMKGPDWTHTAIFLTWDDWGGFYDHVPPIRVDANGYGKGAGHVDQSVGATRIHRPSDASFDAYLKFIEDRFLGGARIDPSTDGWPDPRPTVREEVSLLGSLDGVRLHAATDPSADRPALSRRSPRTHPHTVDSLDERLTIRCADGRAAVITYV